MRKQLLLVDPLFTPKGGGSAVAFWTLEALKDVYDVTVMAWKRPDTDTGNALFGTALRPDDFRLRCPPKPVRWVGEAINWADPDDYSVQRWAILMRLARRIAPQFDAVLTTNGEMDVGVPAIQYVHYPYLAEASNLASLPRMPLRRSFWRLISGLDFESVARNRALVNSDWTGDVYRDHYGAPTHTLYPPVPGAFPDVPWEDREDGFVCVGRLNQDKRLDLIIDVVAAVRARHPAFHLHLIGTPMPEEPGGAAYHAHLRRRAAEHADWVHLEEGLSREALLHLVARHRYGIHAKQDEHFGIGVAEMVKAGCITFTHRSGGQVEIVSEEELLYDDEAEAVRRALAVIEQPALQQALRSRAQDRAQRFSAERFASELRAQLADFLSA